jgi:hypothetical protein
MQIRKSLFQSLIMNVMNVMNLVLCVGIFLTKSQVMAGDELSSFFERAQMKSAEKSGDKSKLSKSTEEFVRSLLQHFEKDEIKFLDEDGILKIKITTDTIVKGEVAKKSRIPYHFSIVPYKGEINIAIEDIDEKTMRVHLNDHLKARFVSKEEVVELAATFPWYLPLRSIVVSALEESRHNEFIEMGSVIFGIGNKYYGPKVVVAQGIQSNTLSDENRIKSEKLLLKNWIYKSKAESAANLGCFFLGTPDLINRIPLAEADIINRLFMIAKENGEGVDGRMTWTRIPAAKKNAD